MKRSKKRRLPRAQVAIRPSDRMPGKKRRRDYRTKFTKAIAESLDRLLHLA